METAWVQMSMYWGGMGPDHSFGRHDVSQDFFYEKSKDESVMRGQGQTMGLELAFYIHALIL